MKGCAKRLEKDNGFKNKLSNKLKSLGITDILGRKGGLNFEGEVSLEQILKFKYLGMTLRVYSFKVGVNYEGKRGISVPVYLMDEQRQVGFCIPLLTYEQCGFEVNL